MTKKMYEGFSTAQVSVGTSATKISSAANGLDAVTIQNLGATAVYIGNSNAVTTSTGFPIPGTPGASLTLEATTDIWGIVGSGSQTVAVLVTN